MEKLQLTEMNSKIANATNANKDLKKERLFIDGISSTKDSLLKWSSLSSVGYF